jgi:hypothetical protein
MKKDCVRKDRNYNSISLAKKKKSRGEARKEGFVKLQKEKRRRKETS